MEMQMPPPQIPQNIMNNYAVSQHAERLDDITDNSPENYYESAPFLLNNGGKVLAVLIAFSTIIFLILFYDSMCIEKSIVIPDKLDLIMSKLNIKIPEM